MLLRKRERQQAARMGVLLRVERELWASGVTRVAGCDEVGVGPLAGPVVAAAVILSPDCRIRGVDDSKKLTPQRREELAEQLHAEACAIGIGVVEVDDVDRLNVYHAALEAMRRAVIALPIVPEHIVVDARTIPQISIPQTPLIGGDGRCYSVAAASIVAKVARDHMMRQLHEIYPEYGFVHNMGYGTAEHLAAIDRHGPTPVHRRSFAPVRQLRLSGM
jgi:ribonuclease HII